MVQGSSGAKRQGGSSAAPYSWNNLPPRQQGESALTWLRRGLKAERKLLADQELRGETMFAQGDSTFDQRFAAWEARVDRYMRLSRLIGEPD